MIWGQPGDGSPWAPQGARPRRPKSPTELTSRRGDAFWRARHLYFGLTHKDRLNALCAIHDPLKPGRENPALYTSVFERFPEWSERISQLLQRDAIFDEICSDYEELAQWLVAHSHDDCTSESAYPLPSPDHLRNFRGNLRQDVRGQNT